MHHYIAIATMLGVLLTSTFVHGTEKTSAPVPKHEHYITGGVGVLGSSGGFGSFTDFLALWRIGPVAIGTNAQFGSAFLGGGYAYTTFAPVAGIMMRPSQYGAYWGILGTIGANCYDGVGHDPISGDPGFSTMLPYAGVRGVVGGVHGQGKIRLTTAIHGFVNVDLRRETQTYTFFSSGDTGFGLAPSNAPAEEEATHTAGTTRLCLMFALGAAF